MLLNRIYKSLPNAITCANLFSGCIGIVFALKGNLNFAAYAIFVSAVFDFFDGFAARMLKAYSDIGKELDSLADVVSFGVLPGAIIYGLLTETHQIPSLGYWLNYTAFLIPVFSALRLAKFNIDTRQTESFIGLPTPANAILIASLPLIASYYQWAKGIYFANPYILLAFSLVMCALLVVEIPMMSLKFKNFNLQKNIYRYLLLAFSAIAILFFKFAAIPAIIFFYILLSIFQFKFAGNSLLGNDKKS
jgi:CDP-diacylglycerol---serine O-phosphatidyltransferase